ncbi:hypothetical protein [Halobaculum roseum]|uniref:Uncharacterized protein n=1 Tax=Halobaculum roseum TaxID=2175149 RepID=A0ABD5MK94_9EURY|nr:hypothetical protein [Halobaculum roseum]QZY02592.1 hypothetical protein K6T36_15090 [Halobaculum roseum]
MSKTSDGAFTHVRGELAWTIAMNRKPSEAVAMVEHLHAADEGRFELLGLTDDCEIALFWDHVFRRVVEAEFDADGVDNLRDPESDEFDRYEGRRDYLRQADFESWDLVHPRHQWLLRHAKRDGVR